MTRSSRGLARKWSTSTGGHFCEAKGCGGNGRQWAYSVWVAAAAAFALAACARPLSSPEVIGGGDRTVSIKAGQWSNVDAVATRHCENYGRRAIARGRTRLSGTELTYIYNYDCVADQR